MSRLEVFLLAVALANLVAVVELVRRRRLLEGYALLWIGVGVGAIVAVAARPALDWVARTVGIAYGASLVLAVGLAFLLFVSMGLSVHLSRLEARTEALAEEVAFLRGVRPPAEPAPAEEGLPGPAAPHR